MSKMTQKEAVFAAVSTVLREANISTEGTSAKAVMTKELRAQVNLILFAGLRNGDVELSSEKTDAELKTYASGLQSNWLNKDDRLNGGVAYVTKNPGSRTGSGDAQVKALRALLANTDDEAEKTEIQGYLDARLEEIGSAKKSTKKPTVDFSALPAELQAKYNTSEET